MLLPHVSRRRFIQVTAGLAVTGAGATGCYLGTQTSVPLGLIGVGSRGSMLAQTFTRRWCRAYGDVRVVCDVDRAHAEWVRKAYCPGADIYQDYRRVLEREDVRAVVIATPDHWHAPIASAALRAGKAVYLEKPLALTIGEGQQLVRTVQETGGVLLVGTQQRSDWRFQRACELVRNGRLGRLKRVIVQLDENPTGGPFPSALPPERLDWDRWLGPAPQADYCPQRCHRSFRSWYEYAGGEITDWGAHHVDIALWAMGLDDTGPLVIDGQAQLPEVADGFNVPQRFDVEMEFPDDVRLRIVTANRKGILFEGDEGRIFVNRHAVSGKPVEQLKQHPLPSDAERFGHGARYWEFADSLDVHVQHFFDCLLNGRTPISDVASQHRAASVCHLANICLRLGRKLRWDPERQEFLDDPAADTMLSRAPRASCQVEA
jgi:myo-inositol 2-dehydrogenase/D-chiro-inositol 1-dehydrogenase